MSAQDLITKWEDALAEAQLAASPPDYLSDGDLEAAEVPVITVRSGLRAGGTDEGCSFFVGECLTWCAC